MAFSPKMQGILDFNILGGQISNKFSAEVAGSFVDLKNR